MTVLPSKLAKESSPLAAAQYAVSSILLLSTIDQSCVKEGQEPEQTQTPDDSLQVPPADEFAMANRRKMAVMAMERWGRVFMTPLSLVRV